MTVEDSFPARLLRRLPSVDQVLGEAEIRAAAGGMAPEWTAHLVRETLEALRNRWLATNGNGSNTVPEEAVRETAIGACRDRILAVRSPHIARTINATGIVLHTGLGRSPLAGEAIAAVAEVSRGYCDVAISRETGGRKSRSSGVEQLLRILIGCEAAVVTNNNAAATMLALHTLARDREVIVSRGQLVEIGGSFRLPEVMTSAGARLREVGTTNRTRIGDYEAAIGEQTGAIMRIHPSNYQIVGFTESVGIEALVELGRRRGVPVIDDIGSGALLDLEAYGLKGETPARAGIAAGADLVLFSGDKLLGGPQAGIVAGTRAAVERCAKNPLMRALRVDKMTIAALEATLRLYLEPDRLGERLPLLRMIAEPAAQIRARGEALLTRLRAAEPGIAARLEPAVAFVGGGSLPTEELESAALVLEVSDPGAEAMKRRLRMGDPPVFCRVRQGRLEFDLRTVGPDEVDGLARGVVAAWRAGRT